MSLQFCEIPVNHLPCTIYVSCHVFQRLARVASKNEPHALYVFVEPPVESCLTTFTSCRWVVGCMACYCFFLAHATRNNLSITIVCMVKEDNDTVQLKPFSRGQCHTGMNNTEPIYVSFEMIRHNLRRKHVQRCKIILRILTAKNW